MNNTYDKLEYVGKGKGTIIEILPSRLSIKITKDNPYVFKSSDSLDDRSIKYYKSLESSGVKLHEISNDEVIKVESVNKDEEVKSDSKVNNFNEVAEKVPEVEHKLESDDSKIPTEEVSAPEVVNNKLDGSKSELIEFLDMNYSDEELRSIARNCGVKRVMSSWNKETLINKIVYTNPDFVIKLIKGV